MTDVAVEAAKAAAQATAGPEARKPQPLTAGEQAAAVFLFIAGLVTIGLTLFAFSSTDADFTFKAKEKTFVERLPAKGAGSAAARAGAKKRALGKCRQKANAVQRRRCRQRVHRRAREAGRRAKAASPLKTTREVDYSDTVAIFALTLGAALALAGGFYARLRSLKLGGLQIGLVDPDAMKAATEKAGEKAEQKIEQRNITDPGKKEAAIFAAQQVVMADLTNAAAIGIPATEQIVEGMAEQAAAKSVSAIASQS